MEMQLDVVRQLKTNSWDEVCRAVGIGRSSLSILRKRHSERLGLQPRPSRRKRQRTCSSPRQRRSNPEKPHNDFIELPVSSVPRLQVEIRLPTGITVRAHSASDVDAVGALIARVLADAAVAT